MEEVPFTLSPLLTAFLSLFFVVLLAAWFFVVYRTTEDLETSSPPSSPSTDPDDLLPESIRDRLRLTPVRRAFNLGPNDTVDFDPSEFEREDVFARNKEEPNPSTDESAEQWPPSIQQIERERKTDSFDWGDLTEWDPDQADDPVGEADEDRDPALRDGSADTTASDGVNPEGEVSDVSPRRDERGD